MFSNPHRISIVVKGTGMVRVLRSSISKSSPECENARFKVEEGDIFAVPLLHPMSQMSFNNESLVFVGFTTSAKNNEPQFLAGSTSALQMLDRQVLAASFNVSNVVIDGLLSARKDAVVLGCPACAEGELEKLKMEEESKGRDDERKREEGRGREEETVAASASATTTTTDGERRGNGRCRGVGGRRRRRERHENALSQECLGCC